MSSNPSPKRATAFAAIVLFALLAACSELDRAIGCLGSQGDAPAQAGQPSADGTSGAAGQAASCVPLEKCGGDLLAGAVDVDGTLQVGWVGTTRDTCIDPPVAPQEDDCHGLVLQPDGSLHFRPSFPFMPFTQVELQFRLPDQQFFAHFRRQGPQRYTFSAACRAAQPLFLSCPALGHAIDVAIAPESNVRYFRCVDAAAGGCLCDYDLSLFSGVLGSFATAGGAVTFHDEQAFLPSNVVHYCLRPDQLELTTQSDLGLFNIADWHTVVLHRPTCGDGLQDQDETGVDCGGPCSATCATCIDGLQSQGETGVDCGGPCPDFCACFNGVQDAWEEGIDCGGPCSLACSCRDGVRDGHEEGVDCGGDCQARFGRGDGIPVLCQ